ncbi:hypothetical protein J6590_010510 [Homalodisca vitripennis]|nr:hypothetical protein J6590_010510 [Homalodisca vitripennis]
MCTCMERTHDQVPAPYSDNRNITSLVLQADAAQCTFTTRVRRLLGCVRAWSAHTIKFLNRTVITGILHPYYYRQTPLSVHLQRVFVDCWDVYVHGAHTRSSS